jgi:hypothetical protein
VFNTQEVVKEYIDVPYEVVITQIIEVEKVVTVTPMPVNGETITYPQSTSTSTPQDPAMLLTAQATLFTPAPISRSTPIRNSNNNWSDSEDHCGPYG